VLGTAGGVNTGAAATVTADAVALPATALLLASAKMSPTAQVSTASDRRTSPTPATKAQR
jgi:hypothetical protein